MIATEKGSLPVANGEPGTGIRVPVSRSMNDFTSGSNGRDPSHGSTQKDEGFPQASAIGKKQLLTSGSLARIIRLGNSANHERGLSALDQKAVAT